MASFTCLLNSVSVSESESVLALQLDVSEDVVTGDVPVEATFTYSVQWRETDIALREAHGQVPALPIPAPAPGGKPLGSLPVCSRHLAASGSLPHPSIAGQVASTCPSFGITTLGHWELFKAGVQCTG